MAISARNADFRGATITKAFLNCACLVGSNLEGADLTDSNLWGADLSGANLKGAILTRVNFESITFNYETIWPGSFDLNLLRTVRA